MVKIEFLNLRKSMWKLWANVINKLSKLMILVPTTLSDGTYELSVTTQSSTGSTLLKEPRTDILGVNIIIS